MEELIAYFQLGANGFALIVAGWIYAAYVKNIRSTISIKDEQISAVEKNLQFWKDKAGDLEKRTPEYMEDVLSKRISHREAEIQRLNQDAESNVSALASRTTELSRLKQEYEAVTDYSNALTYYDYKSDSEVVIPQSEIELIVLGEVGVDSGQLMITDPVYTHKYWGDKSFEDLRLYKNKENGDIYQYLKDFDHYDTIISSVGKSLNELTESGTVKALIIEREHSYDYNGACGATQSEGGYGVLKFESGHEGAGLCIRTVHGDGGYLVMGEMYKGDIVRVFLDLQ